MLSHTMSSLHIRTHDARDGETCGHCHKPARKLVTIRGLQTRFCETCISRITDGLSDERETISYVLGRKHEQDARGYQAGSDK